MDAVLAKPVEFDILMDALHRYAPAAIA